MKKHGKTITIGLEEKSAMLERIVQRCDQDKKLVFESLITVLQSLSIFMEENYTDEEIIFIVKDALHMEEREIKRCSSH